MRACLAFAFSAVLLAQVPATDRRNTETPNTDTHFRMPRYRTLEQWEKRRQALRSQILAAAGLLPMPAKTPLHAQVFGRIEGEGYSIEKVLLETLPGYWLGGNLYRPAGGSGKAPAVLSPHGHWTYGRLEHTEQASIPARCINMARQGFVVFAYDMVGWNDTVQTPHRFGHTDAAEILWSFGPLGLQLWNSIRAIDFVQSLPEVDGNRIGMTGASGGGTQTFLTAAVDERIGFAAPVNMISAIMQGGSPCENAPGLRAGASNMELAALIAPRPMLMVAATGDWTRNTPKEEYPALLGIYQLYGKGDLLETVQFDAPHNYNRDSREAVYRFFGRRMMGADPARLAERGIRLEKLQDMLALHGRTLPPGALDFTGVFRQWRSIGLRLFEQTRNLGELRERMRVVLGAEWPDTVLRDGAGERVTLGREGAGDCVPGLWFHGSGRPALIVHPEGAEAARISADAAAVLAARRPLLLIDAFQTGTAVAPRDRSHEFFLTFNRSDDAHRVQDILTALRSLDVDQPELICSGRAAVWCTFAAAVAPVKVRLTADLGAFRGSDQDFARDLMVPGIQRVGGLAAARRLLAGE